MPSLNKLAVRGATWTIASYGVSQTLRFISNLILTRLLVPEMFGLMSLVYTFINGISLFSDVGVRPSIIQNPRGNKPEFYNTAWTLQVLRGVGVWLICCAIALPVSQFYNNSQLLWLIPIVGFTSVIFGFNSTSIIMLSKQVKLVKPLLVEFCGYFLSLVIMIVWAWFSPTIWALIAGNFFAAVFKMIWSFYLIPNHRNYFSWDKEALKELFSFGKWIFISTALGFLLTQSDRLILAKIVSLKMLGIYTVAYALSDIPRQILMKLRDYVIFPIMSSKNQLPRPEYRSKILQKRWLILLLVGGLLIFLTCFGDLIILTLYDKRYEQGAWITPILALGLWQTSLYTTMESSLVAISKPEYRAYGNFLTLPVLWLGIPLAFSSFGLVGAILVISFADLPKYVVMLYGLWCEGLNCFVQDVTATFLFMGGLAIFGIIRVTLGLGLPVNLPIYF